MQHITITEQIPRRTERPDRRFSLVGSNIAMSYTDSFIESNISVKRCQMQYAGVGTAQHATTPLCEKTGVVAFL